MGVPIFQKIDMTVYSKATYPGCCIDIAEFIPSFGQKEYHLMLHPEAGGSFQQQYSNVKSALSKLRAERYPCAVPVFMRWFLSDSANQQRAIEADMADCAVSFVEQPPLDGTKLTLWVWMAEGASVAKVGTDTWTAGFAGATHVFTSAVRRYEGDSEYQMYNMFESYSDMLEGRGSSLKDNCIRTWLYVQNIDINYHGVVKGRRDFFDKAGLRSDTHYIASTGIAGRTAEPQAKVIMDAYAVEGISGHQIQFLKAPTHLNPTHEYGVTFERGTTVHYPDRKHVFISGTASINNKGEIVFTGDIVGQTLRMIENVGVLLKEAGCSPEDIMQITVYLRDIADIDCVRKLVEQLFPQQPKTFLWAPVCRPGWLVEMECIAVR